MQEIQKAGAPHPDKSHLPPQIINPITSVLIARLEMPGEEWVEKYSAVMRKMVENDPALREFALEHPD